MVNLASLGLYTQLFPYSQIYSRGVSVLTRSYGRTGTAVLSLSELPQLDRHLGESLFQYTLRRYKLLLNVQSL